MRIVINYIKNTIELYMIIIKLRKKAIRIFYVYKPWNMKMMRAYMAKKLNMDVIILSII